MHKKKNHNGTLIEIILVAIIAACMIVLINLGDHKMKQVLSSRDSIVLRANPDAELHDDLAEEMIKFKDVPCTMIETYDSDFNIQVRVCFSDDVPIRDIREYPELIQVLRDHPEGHTRFEIGDFEQDVYFRWTEQSDGAKRIALAYETRPIVRDTWVNTLICYIILILIFILVLRLHFSQQRDRIQHYQNTSASVRKRIFERD